MLCARTGVWDVGADGAATNIDITDAALPTHAVTICTATELKTWRFPPELAGHRKLSLAFGERSDAGDAFETFYGDSAR